MKLRVFSDIHNEIRRYYQKNKYKPWFPEPLATDKDTILILAGDIDHAKQIPKYLNLLAPQFKAVIHVAGNHEFYGSNVQSCRRKMQEGLADNVYHLDNECVTIEGQKFLGTTMWTNLTGREAEIMRVMNDYRQIRTRAAGGYRRIHPYDTTEYHKLALQFIANNVTKDTIVITHHSPISPGNSALGGFNPYGIQPSDVDYAYHACLENQILDDWNPKAWISGHVHKVSDNQYFNTRLITNCVGYMGEEADYQQGIYEIN